MKDIIKYAKFIFGGGLGLLINIAVTYLLTDVLGIMFRLSYALGLVVNVIFNFFYHRHITFNKKDKSIKRLYKFIPITLAVTAANYILVLLFTSILVLDWIIPFFKPYYKYIAIIGITGIVSVINYYVNKKMVFE